LQPTLHDEAYAYLPAVADIFHKARGLLFISAGEYELARRLFGPGIVPKSHVVGAGVDLGLEGLEAGSIGTFDPRAERFILYLGRQDPAKNVDLLVDGFLAYRSRRPLSELKLVLAGARGRAHARGGNGVVDLGFVDESAKEQLLRRARALAQPSRNESYSRVMMEAWLHGRPVIVHEECLATSTAMREAQGGWTARSLADWARTCELVDLADEQSLAALGARGRVYALEYGAWERVIARYETALQSPESPPLVESSAAAVDPHVWDLRPDAQLIAALQDGADNLLFCGPFTAQAHLEQLIESFLHYLTLVRDARMILLCSGRVDHAVYQEVVREVESLSLTDHVLVVPQSPLPLLTAIFRTSHLFWSMAEDEEITEQLQTAMWFDVPVLAYKNAAAAAVAETGVLFTAKDDLLSLAALAKVLVHDPKLRAAIVAKGREKCAWPAVPA
jgi:hypothetical protein